MVPAYRQGGRTPTTWLTRSTGTATVGGRDPERECAMSTYRFSSAERYAIFLVHGMKCYLCRASLDLTSMVVDHVMPEHLLTIPSVFDAVRSALGLPVSFDLNSFENWPQACAPYNGRKLTHQFEPSLLIQVELQHLVEKADKARRLCDEVIGTRRVSIALNTLERAQESGQGLDGSRAIVDTAGICLGTRVRTQGTTTSVDTVDSIGGDHGRGRNAVGGNSLVYAST